MDRSQNRTFRAKTARSKHEIVRGLNLLRPKNSLTKLKKKSTAGLSRTIHIIPLFALSFLLDSFNHGSLVIY